MQLECAGKQVKQELLNNVNSTLNKQNAVCSTFSTFAFERC